MSGMAMDEHALEIFRRTLSLDESELEATYTEFRSRRDDKKAEAASEEDEFLSYLRRRGVISDDTYRRAAAMMPVEVTGRAGASSVMESIRYDLFDTIAEGAMGTIVVGRDRDLRRKVAVKILKAEPVSEDVLRRFIGEAQVTAQLDHPNIVPIYSLNISPEGSVSFAMKLVHGKTLREFIAETRGQYRARGRPDGEHSLHARLAVFLRVCDAIAFAHSKGVIHRDLKPDNIMIGEFGEVYVMDWGVARVVSGKGEGGECAENVVPSPSDECKVIGTPRYMAPEQARGECTRVDERSDLYALGIMLFELTLLKPAREGETLREMLRNAEEGRLAPLEHAVAGERVPVEIKAIVRRATALRMDERYATVRELADDIRRFLRGEEVRAKPDTLIQKYARILGRHRYGALVALLAAFGIAGVGGSLGLYARIKSMRLAHLRENRLAAFQSSVARRSHLIDSHFVRLEEKAIHLARSSALLLEHGRPAGTAVYEYTAFGRHGEGVPGLAYAPAYGMRVSLEYPACKVPEGHTFRESEESFRRLAPLREEMRGILEGSRIDREKDPHWCIRVPGTVVKWAYVGLEGGEYMCYPGSGDYPADYDPRCRPWYRRAVEADAPVWSRPYVDIDGHTLVLTCSVPIRGREGGLLGVAGIDLLVEAIVENYARPAARRAISSGTEAAPVLRAWLLDGEGRILIDSGGGPRSGRIEGGVFKPALFFDEQVVRSARLGRPGLFHRGHGRSARALVSCPVPSLGWAYVESADMGWLLGDAFFR